MNFYDKWHAAARAALGILLITCAASTPDGQQPFLNNVTNIADCVGNPSHCYRVRQAVENGFANGLHPSISLMATEQLKFLDLEFMAGN
ncbi:hypothetical protein C8R45DRAFT_1008652 [Mycena sanguinolenta]|nr:hypothetical protein C8R45DRAFT_1008652 [Mycena sanguinolenta]